MDLGAYRDFHSMEMAFTLMEHLENVISVHRFTLQKLCSGPCKQIVLLLDVVNVAAKFFLQVQHHL